MPLIIAVIVLFILISCGTESPTQNYYKKDVTNEEYIKILNECENFRDRIFDREYNRNSKSYSYAVAIGESGKDECFKEKGFIKGGDASQAAEAEEAEKALEAELIKFAIGLSTSTKNNIFNPTLKKKRYDHFVITFETLDPHLLKKGSNNALANDTANALWGAKFCTEELESIIIFNELNRVEGRILNGEMFLAVCDDTDATSNEILFNDLQDSLKRIQSMINR